MQRIKNNLNKYKVKRPKILEENNDLLEQVNYLIEMDKYCDYLEEQNKQLYIHGVMCSFVDELRVFIKEKD